MAGNVPHRRAKRALCGFFFLVVALAIAACGPASPPGARPNPFPDESTGGAPAPLRGAVTFHDTGLPLAAVVAVAEQIIVTEDGRFTAPLPPGSHPYRVGTHVGAIEGFLDAPSEDPIALRVPAFAGWSSSVYNELLFAAGRNFTVRWPDGERVRVWIEPYSTGAMQAARSAFADWQGLLGDAVLFNRVERADRADMTIQFVPEWALPGGGTIGTCTRWYSRTTGWLRRGEIQIARSWATHPGLLRHEIGHCLGLGHSPLREHLMYSILYNEAITPTEGHMARLLYSLPPGSPTLSSSVDSSRLFGSPGPLPDRVPPAGRDAEDTVMEIIY